MFLMGSIALETQINITALIILYSNGLETKLGFHASTQNGYLVQSWNTQQRVGTLEVGYRNTRPSAEVTDVCKN